MTHLLKSPNPSGLTGVLATERSKLFLLSLHLSKIIKNFALDVQLKFLREAESYVAAARLSVDPALYRMAARVVSPGLGITKMWFLVLASLISVVTVRVRAFDSFSSS